MSLIFTAGRAFLGWIAGNWAGLSAGYALGDIFSDEPQAPLNPVDAGQKKVSEAITKATGLPYWAGSLVTLFALFLIVRRFLKK